MTYQRVIHRNYLAKGDYEIDPSWPMQGINLDEKAIAIWGSGELSRQIGAVQGRLRMLCGDLRRLEWDAIDEAAIAQVIATRTGVDKSTVAAVLKEFLAY